MKKNCTLFSALSLLLLLASIGFKANGQAPAWLWAANEGRNVYEEAYTVATDETGNCYVGGYYNTYIYNLPHSLGPDAFIVKYDPAGNVSWTAAISEPGRERIVSVALDKVGNYYIMGTFDGDTLHFNGITFVNAESNAYDIFIAKYDTSHNFIWARHVGGLSDDTPTGMAVDSIGNCYITGWFNGPKIGFDGDTLTNSSTNFADIFVAKYNPGGTILWAKSAIGGGGGSDKSNSISIDRLGNCYITGDFNSTTLVFDAFQLHKRSNFNMYLAKFLSNGTVAWAIRANGTGDSHGYAVAVDPQMNCYVTGSFRSNLTMGTTTLTAAGYGDIFVAKYAPDSTVLWVSSAGGTALDEGTALATDDLGYCYATGYFNSDTISFGTWKLANNYPGFEDIFLTVFDSYGNVQWAKSIGGNHNDFPNSIATDPSRNCIIAGWLGSAQIAIGDTTLVNNGSSDVLVAKSANTAPSGIKESDPSRQILIYPNPADESVAIACPQKATVEIINMQGKVCKSLRKYDPELRFDLTDLPRGLYLVKVTSDDFTRINKLVKN